jgi:hypothetical protein
MVASGAAPVATEASAAMETIRSCTARVSPGLSGLKDLGTACPGLEDALQTLGLDRQLYDGWRERLNRDSLQDAVKLAQTYRGSQPGSAPPIAALPGVLEALARDRTSVPPSWWDSFKAWLASWLKSHDADSLSWLDHLLEHFRRSITLLNALLYSLIGLVLLAAVWVVVSELKAAGLFGRRNNRAAATHDSAGSAAAGSAASEESEPSSLAGQLRRMLRLIVQQLLQTGRLQADRSLTHRELVSRSTFDDESQRAAFAAVAGAAESILYGAHDAGPEHLRQVLRQGEILLAQLPTPVRSR